MATYFQSLNVTGVSDTDHIATVTGTYTATAGGTVPDGPYHLAVNTVNASGLTLSDTDLHDVSVSNGRFSFTYNAQDFPISGGQPLSVSTTDTADGTRLSSASLTQTSDIDGYLAGATVFVDTNSNGALDAGEYSTLTDVQGNAFLPAGSGQIVSIGGTDTQTGLGFVGTMTAPARASVITPLTTLINEVAKGNGGDVAAAQAAVAQAFGLPPGLDLNSLDPIAATQAGTSGGAAILAASAAVIDTAKLVAATGASATVFSALAAQIAQGTGTIDLGNAATVAALAATAGAGSDAAAAVGQIAAASNQALIQAAAMNPGDPTAILGAVAAIARTAQGSTTAAVAAAAGDPTSLAQVVAANTGSALTAAIAQSAAELSSAGTGTGTGGSGSGGGSPTGGSADDQGGAAPAQATTPSAATPATTETATSPQPVTSGTTSGVTPVVVGAPATGIVTGPSTNNSPSADGQALQDFLSSTFASIGTVPVTAIGGTGPGLTTASLDGPVGVVAPGSNVALTVTSDAFLFASGGSTVDLSDSPLLNPTGGHLKVNVQLGGGANTVTLNRGPSTVQSTTGNDTLLSGGGHDTLSGGSGHDSLRGGGHSQLFGGSVAGDTLHGGTSAGSHDTLTAGTGGDLMITNAGRNLVYGNGGDTIRAGLAQDTILAGDGAETIHGGLGSTVYGGGRSVMDRGYDNTYKATGADTVYGSQHGNAVVIQGKADGVVVDGRTGTGSLDVTIGTTDHGHDTLFGGVNADGTGSNLTIHVTQSFTEQRNLDQNGLHVVQLAGGQTLHVTNVTIDFNDKRTYV